MKKILTYIVLLSVMMTATAQETKLVKSINYSMGSDNSFAAELRRVLGNDLYKVDSLVISADFYLPSDWTSALLDCCEKGRLTGIDMSQCRYETEIPAAAFLPNMVNGAPRKSEDNGEVNPYRTGLRYITLPSYLEKIGDLAFCNCDLQAIAIPYWVDKVGDGAFSGCENLKDVVLYGDKPRDEAMGWQFSELPAGAVLHVAPGCAQYYSGKEGWTAFGEVREDDTAFKTKILELDGSVALKDILGADNMRVDSMKISGMPTAEDFETLRNNVIYGRLYSVDFSEADFGDCRNRYMASCKMDYLIMPKVVKEIPTSFLSRSSVRHLELPESYERIRPVAFRQFTGVLSNDLFVVPEGCRRICTEAFVDCKGIKSMILPSTLDELEPWALGFKEYHWNNTPELDLYVNRMYPPAFVSETNYKYDDYYMVYGPFGEGWGVRYPTATWRLYVPVGAKKNYENAEHWDHFLEIIETPLLTGWSTGINETPATVRADAADGIYSLDGRIVSKGTTTGSLPRGLYIVRENGQARKVIMGR